MRVAIYSRFPTRVDAPRGGVETVTVNLVSALASLEGAEVHVVTMERGIKAPKVEELAGATIHRLPASRWPTLLDITMGPGIRRLERYLLALEPDVVHCHETYGLGLAGLSIPCVFTVHGFDHANVVAERRPLASLRAPLWRRLEAWGLRRHRHIISITPYVRRMIEPLTEATIYDIENPLSAASFEVPRREVPGRVFFAGWIAPRKNALGLVKAVGQIVAKGVDATLHLAGEESDAAYAAEVRQAIEDLGLSHRAVLLERITPEQVRKELGEASVFALPSRQENSPMAIAEAMAAGVPVVSSNRCGMPYMIREGETGHLIDPEDTEALADRIGRLLADDDARTKMGRLAKDAAVQRFHPDVVARRTLQLYRAIAKTPVSRGSMVGGGRGDHGTST